MTITQPIVTKLIETVDAGLVAGLGRRLPGQMCVEAAVCFAFDLPHNDKPPCVGASVRRFKISLNDSRWSSNKARAAGMRKLAVAQLGSDAIDQSAFRKIVAEQTIRRIVPLALGFAAKLNPKFKDELDAAALVCANEGTREAALQARAVARKVQAAAAAYAAADAAADAAAYAAADAAADAAAYAAAAAAAAAAADAADAAYAAAADAAAAAADAAYAAAAAAADAADAAYAAAARDKVLQLSAEIGLDALRQLKSPGCEWLYLCE